MLLIFMIGIKTIQMYTVRLKFLRQGQGTNSVTESSPNLMKSSLLQ